MLRETTRGVDDEDREKESRKGVKRGERVGRRLEQRVKKKKKNKCRREEILFPLLELVSSLIGREAIGDWSIGEARIGQIGLEISRAF